MSCGDELMINLNLLSIRQFDHQLPCFPSLDPEIRFAAIAFGINIPLLGSVSNYDPCCNALQCLKQSGIMPCSLSKWSLAERLSANKNQKRQRTLHQRFKLGPFSFKVLFTVWVLAKHSTQDHFLSKFFYNPFRHPSFSGILGIKC